MRIIYKYPLFDKTALNYSMPPHLYRVLTLKEGGKIRYVRDSIWVEIDTDNKDQNCIVYMYVTGQELTHNPETHSYFDSVVFDTDKFHILHIYVPNEFL